MWDNHRMQMFKDLEERFLRYTGYDTMSAPELCGMRRPTTAGQEELLEHLAAELRGMGLDVGYGSEKVVMGTLKGDPSLSPVAFMAHVDTADDVPGNGVKARVWRDYDGSDIVLDGVTIRTSENPDLQLYRGGTIITSDGTTLLGADDKAGVAIIMEVVGYLSSHPEVRHPDIEVFFTPDEETGEGMSAFPFDQMRSRICYTLDGGPEGEVEAECFNAASALVDFCGEATHFGDGRGRLRSAVTAAAAFVSMLPGSESPQATDGRYGYYAVERMEGTTASARVELLIRDFSSDGFERRIAAVRAAAEAAALMHRVDADCSISVSYRNMADANRKRPEALEAVFRAASRLGMDMHEAIIRGGTDGARLAEKGIASPNLFTGGHCYHSLTEWIALEAMERSASLVLAIIEELGR